MTEPDPWWVNGILYENCTCQLLCPAHVSFKQACEGEMCLGYWGIHVNKGRFGKLVLDQQNAVVLYESPPKMHEGDWVMKLYLDDSVDGDQSAALEQILGGGVGGPWNILSQFVATWVESEKAPIRFENTGLHKRLHIDGVLESLIDDVEVKRTGQTATLGNLFNVMHAAAQYLATGSSTVTDPRFTWSTKEKHALWSEFSWTGP